MDMQDRICDITIVGGGPTGLYAAFCAGLRSMSLRVIDSQEFLGGQLSALYPDKFIYDVPGYPAVLARTLAGELVRQMMNYHPAITLGEQVQSLRAGEKHLFEISTDRTIYRSRSVVVAVGGGAMTPNRLSNPAIRAFEGRGVEYLLMDLSEYRRRRVLVVGGGDAAVDACLLLKRVTPQVTLIHRQGKLRAAPDAQQRLTHAGVETRFFHELISLRGDAHVTAAMLRDQQSGREETLAIDDVLVCIGSTSSCGPIHEWGLAMDQGGISVTARMETSMAGVFAAGDIASYPGKIKLLATAFSEAATAVNHAKVFVDPASPLEPGRSTVIVPKQREEERRRNASSESTR